MSDHRPPGIKPDLGWRCWRCLREVPSPGVLCETCTRFAASPPARPAPSGGSEPVQLIARPRPRPRPTSASVPPVDPATVPPGAPGSEDAVRGWQTARDVVVELLELIDAGEVVPDALFIGMRDVEQTPDGPMECTPMMTFGFKFVELVGMFDEWKHTLFIDRDKRYRSGD